MEKVCSLLSTQTVENVQGKLVETVQKLTAADRVCTQQGDIDKELVEMQSVTPGPTSTVNKWVEWSKTIKKRSLVS